MCVLLVFGRRRPVPSIVKVVSLHAFAAEPPLVTLGASGLDLDIARPVLEQIFPLRVVERRETVHNGGVDARVLIARQGAGVRPQGGAGLVAEIEVRADTFKGPATAADARAGNAVPIPIMHGALDALPCETISKNKYIYVYIYIKS